MWSSPLLAVLLSCFVCVAPFRIAEANGAPSHQEQRTLHHRPRGSYALNALEIQALEDLYVATNGDSWLSHNNWMVTNDPCTWQFVVCANGHVINLDLSHNNLDGTLPASIGNFENLYHLMLNNNNLRGPIPASIGQLGELRSLRLSFNSMDSSLPAELGDLSRLVYLALNNNQFTGTIPPSIGQLTALSQFRLEYNDFVGPLPESLSDLWALKSLWVNDNNQDGPEDQRLEKLRDYLE